MSGGIGDKMDIWDLYLETVLPDLPGETDEYHEWRIEDSLDIADMLYHMRRDLVKTD